MIRQGDVDRPELMKEQVQIARRLWTGETVEQHSAVYDFDDVDLKPQPLFPVPVWWGGATPASARLAVEFCDGWLPGRITFPTYEARVDKIREMVAEQGQARCSCGAVPVTSIDDSFASATAAHERPRPDQERQRPEASGSSRRRASSRPSRSSTARSWRAPLTTSCAGVQRYQEIGCDLLIFDFRMRFPDWLDQIQVLASEVLPRVSGST